LCNTDARVLEDVVPRLDAVTRSGSWAVVSGFRKPDAVRIRDLFAAHGWSGRARSGREEWCVVEATR
jgi:ribosomal protein L11 methylase PrmA